MIKAKEKWEVRSHGKTQGEKKKKVFLGENEKKKMQLVAHQVLAWGLIIFLSSTAYPQGMLC